MEKRRTMYDILKESRRNDFIITDGVEKYVFRLDEEKPVFGCNDAFIAYNAWKQCNTSEGEKVYKRVILKEFYPELLEDVRGIRTDENVPGVPGGVDGNQSNSVREYEIKLHRFKKSYDTFLMLHNNIGNIVNVADIVEANNTWYIIEEYSSAVSLEEYIDLGEATLYDIVKIIMKVSKVMCKLHSFKEKAGDDDEIGYLHLGLSPSSILYCREDDRVILDTSYVIKQSDIWEDIALEYLEKYSAPELREGSRDRIDERSDIYSLGAILYMCIMDDKGRTADIWNMDEKEAKVWKENIDNILLNKYDIESVEGREAIVEFLYKTISLIRSRRYRCMEEVVEALSNICDII